MSERDEPVTLIGQKGKNSNLNHMKKIAAPFARYFIVMMPSI